MNPRFNCLHFIPLTPTGSGFAVYYTGHEFHSNLSNTVRKTYPRKYIFLKVFNSRLQSLKSQKGQNDWTSAHLVVLINLPRFQVSTWTSYCDDASLLSASQPWVFDGHLLLLFG